MKLHFNETERERFLSRPEIKAKAARILVDNFLTDRRYAVQQISDTEDPAKHRMLNAEVRDDLNTIFDHLYTQHKARSKAVKIGLAKKKKQK